MRQSDQNNYCLIRSGDIPSLGRAISIILNLFILFTPLISFATANSGITYHGRILKPDGTALEGQNVQFKIQFRTPGSENCLMYEEIQSKDMQNSSGIFAVTINDGTGTREDTTGYTLDTIFANRGTLSFPSTTCVSGSGGTVTWSPNSSDGRLMQVYFKDETMASWEPTPAEMINFVPMAIEAKQVGGFAASNLLRVQEANGTLVSVSPLNNAQYTELVALANGTSSHYAKVSAGQGVGVPTISGAPTSVSTGSMWFDTSTNTLKYYDGTATQTLGTSGGSVTSITAGAGLTGGTITTAGTIALGASGVTAGTYPKVQVDTYGRVIAGTTLSESDIPTLSTAGTVSGSAINSGTIGGSTAINTTGNIQTTGTLKGSALSATQIATQGVQVFESTNNYKIILAAPSSLSSNYQLTLPPSAGASGQVLTTDGSGVLTWSSVSGVTPGGTAGGDLSGNYPSPTVAKIQGVAVSSTAPLNGQVLKYVSGSTQWQPTNFSIADLKTSIGGGQFANASCGANQTITWSSLTDSFTCTTIAISNTQVAGLGTAALKNIGTTSGTVAAGDDARIVGAVQNAGGVSVVQSGVEASRPAAGVVGLIYIATDTARIYRDTGSSWSVIATATGLGGTVTAVTAGTGLSGGTISSTGTISLANTAVTPGSYGDATHASIFTVDQQGRLTSASQALITGVTPGGSAGGDLTGTYPNPTLNSSAVTTAKIADGAVSTAKLFSNPGVGRLVATDHTDGSTLVSLSCSSGQVLAWNVTTGWTCTDQSALSVASATNFSGSLTGDVTGTQSATVVAKVGGMTAANVAAGATLANSATDANTASTIMKRDSSGNFAATQATLSKIVLNDSGSNTATLQAPTSITSSYVLKLPTTNGTSGQVLSTDGSGNLSWVAATSGSVTSVGVTAPIQSTGGATPTLSIAKATTSTDGYLSQTDWTTFNNKLSTSLASGNIWVGNAGGTAAAVAPTGDVSLSNTGSFSVNAIKGTNISATPTFTGQVLRYDGTNWTPNFVSMQDLRSNVTGSTSLATSCAASQTLTYNSVGDNLTCTNIAITNTQISGLGTAATLNVGTSANNILQLDSSAKIPAVDASQVTSINASNIASGTLNSARLPSTVVLNGGNSFGSTSSIGNTDNQNLNIITNNANRITVLKGGSVGIGTTAPTSLLTLAAGTATAGTAPLKLTSGTNLTTPEAGAIEFDGTSLYYTDATNTRRALASTSGSGSENFGQDVTMSGTGTGLAVTNNATVGGTLTTTGAATLNGGATIAGGALTMSSQNITGVGTNLTGAGAMSVAAGGTNQNLTLSGSGTGSVLLTANVGIGTTAPTAKLNIGAGTATVAPLQLTSGTNLTTPLSGAIEYDGTNLYFTDSGAVRRTIASTSGASSTSFGQDVTMSGAGTGLAVTNNATIGGTLTTTGLTTMTGGFTSAGTAAITNSTASTSSSTGALTVSGGMGVTGNIYSGGVLAAGSGTATQPSFTFGNDTASGMWSPATSAVAFSTNGVERLRVNSSGNIGIGTTNPVDTLQIRSTTNGHTEVMLDGTGVSGRQWTFGTGWTGAGNNNFYIYDNTASAARMVFDASGNVGIGTTNPTSMLTVAGNAAVSGTIGVGGAYQGTSEMYLKGNTNGALDLHTPSFHPNALNFFDDTYSASSAVGIFTAADDAGSIEIGSTVSAKRVWLFGANHYAATSAEMAVGAGVVGVGTNYPLGWASGNIDGALDTGLSRGAANKMYLGNGTAGDYSGTFVAGNVGIGTTAPTAALQIKAGTATVAPLMLTSGTNLTTPLSGAIEYDGTNLYFTDSGAVRRTIASTSGASSTSFGQDVTMSGTGTGLAVTNNATVGGTLTTTGLTTMTGGFTSAGTAAITNSTASTSSSTGALTVSGGMGVAGNIYSGGVLAAGSGTAALPSHTFGSDTASGMWSPATSAVALSTNGVERLRVNSSGYVGIGTTTPTQALDVSLAGTNVARFRSTGANNSIVTIDNLVGGNQSAFTFSDAGSAKWQVGKQTGNTFFLYDVTNSRDAIRIDGSTNVILNPVAGNVGIGLTNTANKLDVNGSAAFGTYAGTAAPSGGMIVSGSVGVGTTAPSYPLDVTGNGRISATLYNDRMETTSGFHIGEGTWSGDKLLYVYKTWQTAATNATGVYGYRYVNNANGPSASIVGTYGQADAYGMGTGNTWGWAIGVKGVAGGDGNGAGFGTVTSAASLYGGIAGSYSTNITNRYGLYLENITGGTSSNYGIYSAGGQNYFAGNVGIGTATTPGQTLDIQGSVATNNGVAIRIGNTNSSNTNKWILGTGGGTVASDAFSIGDNSAYKMTFLANGNVGIGTTSPTAVLNLKAGTTALAPLQLTSGTNLTTPLSGAIEYDGTNLYYTDSGAVRRTIASTSGASSTSFGQDVTMSGAGTGLAVSNNETVGGTLTTTGLTTMTGGFTSAGTAAITNTTASTSTTSGAETISGGLGVAGTVNANILAAANGTAALPSHTFTADTASGMWSPATSAVALSTAGSERMRINSSGYVGIGTTAPAVSLEVNGAVHVGNASSHSGILTINDLYSYESIQLSPNLANTTGVGDYPAIFTTAGTSAGGTGVFGNYGDLVLASRTGGSNQIDFLTGSSRTTSMVINGSGNVGIGTSAPTNKLTIIGSTAALFGYDTTTAAGLITMGKNPQIELIGDGTANNNPNIGLVQLNINGSNAYQSSSEIYLGSTRATTSATVGTAGGGVGQVGNTDVLGQVGFYGDDGTNLRTKGAMVQGWVDTTNQSVSTGAVPVRLVLATQGTAPITFNTAAGGLSGPVTAGERMRITGAGSVGIGTTAPGTTLDVRGNFSVSGQLSENLQYNSGWYTVANGGGTVWTVPTSSDHNFYFGFSDYATAGSAASVANRMVMNTSTGNLGIGTTAPTAKLNITAGTATAGTAPLKFNAGTNLTTPEAGAIEYDGTNLYFTDSGAVRRTIASTSGSSSTSFGQDVTMSGAGTGLAVTNNATVGGTLTTTGLTTMTGGFTSAGTAAVTNSTASTSSSTGALTVSGGMGVSGNIYSGGVLAAGSGTAALPSHTFGSDTASGMWSPATSAVAVSTNGVERLRVNSSGNVGIGTTAPAADLEISDGTAAKINLTKTGTNAGTGFITYPGNNLQLNSGSVAGSYISYQGAAHVFVTQNTATEYARVDSTGLSVNSATHSNRLDVNGAASIGTYSTTAAPANGLIVSGNVGIGTTSPSSALQVNGTATITNGSLIVPAGSGSATSIQVAGSANTGMYFNGTSIEFISNGTNAGFFSSLGYFGAGSSSPGFSNGSGVNPGIWPKQSDGKAGVGADVAGDVSLYGDNAGTATEMLRVSGTYSDFINGNVGIGTTAPSFTLDLVGGMHNSGPSTLTTLSAGALSTDTTLTVVSTAGYPTSGTLYVYTSTGPYTKEAMTYTGTTATTFTGLTRGTYGTSAVALSSGFTVDLCLYCVGASNAAPKLFMTSGLGIGIGSVPQPWMQANGIYGAGEFYTTSAQIAAHQYSYGSSTVYTYGNSVASSADYWTVATNSLERLRIDGSGRIGIGTTAPTSLLTLAAGTSSQAPLQLTSGTNLTTPLSGAIEYDGTNLYFTDSGAVRRTIASTSGASSTSFGQDVTMSGAGTGLAVSNNATIGGTLATTGVTTMTGGFTSAGTAAVTNSTASTSSSTGALTVSGGMGVAGNIYSGGVLAAASGTAALPSHTFGSDTASGLWSPATSAVALSTNGAERMRINSSGNVGIGTTTPAKELEVVGTGRFSVGIDVNGSNVINSSQNLMNLGGTVRAATGNALSFQTNGTNTTSLKIDTAGNVGIGTTAPGGKLDVNQTTAGSIALNGQNAGTAFWKVLSPAGGITAGYNAANAVEYVAKDTGTGRSINAAGTINASGADFAEWVDWPGTQPQMGSIVMFKGSYVVVSSPFTAAFVGNDSKDPKHSILVAFAGQLPVLVKGVVHEGDLIIANDDGTGSAVSKDQITLALSRKAVGTAWAASNDAGLKRVNVAVGIGLGGNGARDIASVNDRAAKLEAENAKIKVEAEKLKQENAAIKSYICSKDPKAPICK